MLFFAPLPFHLLTLAFTSLGLGRGTSESESKIKDRIETHQKGESNTSSAQEKRLASDQDHSARESVRGVPILQRLCNPNRCKKKQIGI